jgi:hypothetical protein
MDKITFNLFDDVFSHDKYSVAGRESKFIKWDRGLSDINNPTFYSHNKIPLVDKKISIKEKSYAILFESKSILPETYKKAEKYLAKFNKVFTHNSEFLKKYDNCFWIPGGGVWIGGSFGQGEIKMCEKTKICSIVSSQKQMCDLHKYRLKIVKLVKNRNVDIFGLEFWQPINISLEDYMFSIVIENYQDELYFTEKILNCFATGTVPIYLGARKIKEKFNIDGIIQFHSSNELTHLKLDKEVYLSKLEAIKDNFNRCLEYLSIEDYIYTNYLNGEV